MPDALDHLDQVMDFVYGQSQGRTDTSVSILGYVQGLGLDMGDAFTIVHACRDAGLGQDTSGMGNPCIRITAAGLDQLRRRRLRSADPALRARASRAGLLRWFYQQRIARVHMPITQEYAGTETARYEGVAFTDDELQDAAEYLADKDLISGVSVDQARGPVRAQITSDGIDCVVDWDGDIPRYLRDQKGYGPVTTYNGPYIQGNAPAAQMAWQSRDVTQQHAGQQGVAVDFKALTEGLTELMRRLPDLHLSEQDRGDVEQAVQEVATELAHMNPDRSRLRRGVAAIRGLLTPAMTAAGGGLAQGLVEQLTSALA